MRIMSALLVCDHLAKRLPEDSAVAVGTARHQLLRIGAHARTEQHGTSFVPEEDASDLPGVFRTS